MSKHVPADSPPFVGMIANPDKATLPQLLDWYRHTATANQGGQLNDVVRLTYQSIALEGTPLTLPKPGTCYSVANAYQVNPYPISGG